MMGQDKQLQQSSCYHRSATEHKCQQKAYHDTGVPLEQACAYMDDPESDTGKNAAHVHFTQTGL